MTTYLFAVKRGVWGDPSDPNAKLTYEGILVSSAGEMLGLGKGSTIDALKDDLCVTDKNIARHEKLRARYKGGYRVVWCPTAKHKGLRAALARLRTKAPRSLDLKPSDAEAFVADAPSQQ